ncbi:hypothetical protein FCV25MIE_14119 [Fagus crenata]
MVTPWRRWWRRGGDDGDSAKDRKISQIRRDLTSGGISPDQRDLTNRQPTPSKNPGSTVEIGLRRNPKDRTSSKPQGTVEIGPPRHGKTPRWRSDLLGRKPQGTVEIGGDWKPKRK